MSRKPHQGENPGAFLSYLFPAIKKLHHKSTPTSRGTMLARAAQGRRVATSSLTARAARCIHASVRCSPAGALPENRASGSQIASRLQLLSCCALLLACTGAEGAPGRADA